MHKRNVDPMIVISNCVQALIYQTSWNHEYVVLGPDTTVGLLKALHKNYFANMFESDILANNSLHSYHLLIPCKQPVVVCCSKLKSSWAFIKCPKKSDFPHDQIKSNVGAKSNPISCTALRKLCNARAVAISQYSFKWKALVKIQHISNSGE